MIHVRTNRTLISHHPINLFFCGLPHFSSRQPIPFSGLAETLQLISDSIYTLTLHILSATSLSFTFQIYMESIHAYPWPIAVHSVIAARLIFEKPNKLDHFICLPWNPSTWNWNHVKDTICNLALPTLLTHLLPLPPPHLHWSLLPQNSLKPMIGLGTALLYSHSSYGCLSLVTHVPFQGRLVWGPGLMVPTETWSQFPVLFY